MKYKIFVINMDESPDRLESIKVQFDKLNLNFERVVGVNASKLTTKEIQERYSVEKSIDEFYRPLSLGQIGCHISHQNAWQKIIDDNLDFGIIIEDDAALSKNLNEAIEFMSKNLDKWQFLRIQKERKRKKIYNVDFTDNSFSIVEYIKTTGCAVGYAITKESSEILLKELIPFGISADTNMHLYDKYGIEVKALRPYVVKAGNVYKSDTAKVSKKIKRRFSIYSRKVFSISSYKTRLKHLLCRDRCFKFSFRLIKMVFRKRTKD